MNVKTHPQPSAEWFTNCYDELCELARQRLAREWQGAGFQPRSLVHEAWLRLGRSGKSSFETRAHFFSAAARTMRCILIDHARHRRAERYGGWGQHVDFDALQVPASETDDQQLALVEALEKLTGNEPLKAELVKLRFLSGFTIEEAAVRLGISIPTAKRYWARARSWLYCELTGSPPNTNLHPVDPFRPCGPHISVDEQTARVGYPSVKTAEVIHIRQLNKKPCAPKGVATSKEKE